MEHCRFSALVLLTSIDTRMLSPSRDTLPSWFGSLGNYWWSEIISVLIDSPLNRNIELLYWGKTVFRSTMPQSCSGDLVDVGWHKWEG